MEAFWLSNIGTPAGDAAYTGWVKTACFQLCGKSLTPATFRRMFMTYALKLTLTDSKKIEAYAKLQNTSPSVIHFYYNRENASEENRLINSEIILGLGLFTEAEIGSETEPPKKKQKTTEVTESPEIKRITSRIHEFAKIFWQNRTPFEFTKTYYNIIDSDDEEILAEDIWESDEEEESFSLDLESDSESEEDQEYIQSFDTEEEEEKAIDFTAMANQCCQSFTIQLEPCAD